MSHECGWFEIGAASSENVSFCSFSFEEKALSDTEFPGRFLSYLLESQTMGMMKEKHSKIRLTQGFKALVYLMKTRWVFPLNFISK